MHIITYLEVPKNCSIRFQVNTRKLSSVSNQLSLQTSETPVLAVQLTYRPCYRKESARDLIGAE